MAEKIFSEDEIRKNLARGLAKELTDRTKESYVSDIIDVKKKRKYFFNETVVLIDSIREEGFIIRKRFITARLYDPSIESITEKYLDKEAKKYGLKVKLNLDHINK
jgi:hypothetical protein